MTAEGRDPAPEPDKDDQKSEQPDAASPEFWKPTHGLVPGFGPSAFSGGLRGFLLLLLLLPYVFFALPFRIYGAGFGITFLSCGLVLIVLSALNGWTEMTEWTIASRILGMVAISTPIFTLAAITTSRQKREHQEWIDKAEKWEPTLTRPDPKAPDPGRSSVNFAWALGGMIPGFLIAWLVGSDPRIGPTLGVPLLLILPFIGGGFGLYYSPQMRANRYHNAKVAEVHRKQERTADEKYRDWITENPEQARSVWRRRAIDSLTWYFAFGQKLYSDPKYLTAIVSDTTETNRLLANFAQDPSRYVSETDPFATRERAAQVAAWAATNLRDEITHNVAQPTERTVDGITDIFVLHRRHGIRVQHETTQLGLEESLRKVEEKTPEGLVTRLLKEFDAVVLAASMGRKMIEERAEKIENRRDRAKYVKDATEGVEAILETHMHALRNRDAQTV